MRSFASPFFSFPYIGGVDIVLSLTTPDAVLTRACLRGLTHLQYDRLFVIGPWPELPMTDIIPVKVEPWMTEWQRIAAAASMESLSEQFIYMSSDTVVMRSYTPAVYANEKFVLRSPEERSMMVNALSDLLAGALATYDYETHLPTLMEKRFVLDVFRGVPPGKNSAVRTVYYNYLLSRPPARASAEVMKTWTVSDDPQGDVLRIEPKALQGRQCKRWLNRKLTKKSRHEC